jgi:hypothetical protein
MVKLKGMVLVQMTFSVDLSRRTNVIITRSLFSTMAQKVSSARIALGCNYQKGKSVVIVIYQKRQIDFVNLSNAMALKSLTHLQQPLTTRKDASNVQPIISLMTT